MTFFNEVPLFDNEDLETLQRKFAELWARYPNQPTTDIGLAVFKDMFEPMRGLQAGATWARDLQVQLWRDEFALRGPSPVEEDWKAQLESKSIKTILGLMDSFDEKIRLDAAKTGAELAGLIVKGGGVTVNNNTSLAPVELRIMYNRSNGIEPATPLPTKPSENIIVYAGKEGTSAMFPDWPQPAIESTAHIEPSEEDYDTSEGE